MNRKPKVSKENLQTAKRLLKYVTGTYKVRFVIVFICILLSSIASISVSLSLKFLIDDFISPLIGQKDPNFAELYRALAVLGSIFLMGVIATFTYTRLMVYIGQGVLKKVRDDMFEHMQTLPIRYFDQNTNGSIMSLYTNDTDTLRQMISQSIPQALMSFFTIIVTLYFNADLKSAAYNFSSSDHWSYDLRNKKDRWKQWKIFCSSAEISGRCDWICGRENERTARSKSVQPRKKVRRRI